MDAAPASSPAGAASSYLTKSQNADGGFGAARGAPSGRVATSWAVLGLEANGANPQDVKRNDGKTALEYVEKTVGGADGVDELARTILLVEGATLSAREFGGRDLVAALLKKRGADGSFGGSVDATALGMLALRAAGEQVGATTLSWLIGSQGADGGFAPARGGVSSTGTTGLVLQALAVVGRSASPAAQGANAYLHGVQGADGGWGDGASNGVATSSVILGLIAVGSDDASVDNARRYLVGLRQDDGSIAYAAGDTRDPVAATSQAVLALRKAPFPLAPVEPKPVDDPKPTKAASEDPAPAPSGGGSSAPAGDAVPAPVTPPPTGGAAPAEPPPVDLPEPSAATPPAPEPAPAAPVLPQTVPTPEPDPSDAASAQRAAAGAGDDGVPPGLAIGIAAAVLAALALLWFARKPLLSAARRGSAVVPGKLRRSH